MDATELELQLMAQLTEQERKFCSALMTIDVADMLTVLNHYIKLKDESSEEWKRYAEFMDNIGA